MGDICFCRRADERDLGPKFIARVLRLPSLFRKMFLRDLSYLLVSFLWRLFFCRFFVYFFALFVHFAFFFAFFNRRFVLMYCVTAQTNTKPVKEREAVTQLGRIPLLAVENRRAGGRGMEGDGGAGHFCLSCLSPFWPPSVCSSRTLVNIPVLSRAPRTSVLKYKYCFWL